MRSTIDAGGRVVIPKQLRERDGHIEIEPAATPMSLVRRAGGSIAVPKAKLPPLTDDVVRDVLERTRR